MKAPIGWFGSFKPTRLRWMAFTILSIAVSCAITSFFRSVFMFLSRIPSASCIRCTGTPVIKETTSAIVSSVISTLSVSSPFCHFSCSSFSFCSNSVCLSRKPAASSKFWFFTASCFFCCASSICPWMSRITCGTFTCWRWVREPASSIISIALSGKKRSEI